MRPKTSWDVRIGEVPSPLAGLSESNPPIVITDEARERAARNLEERTRPYRMSESTRPEKAEPERIPTLGEMEEQHIRRVLSLCEGRTKMAAKILGIGRATLYRRFEELGIDKHGKDVPMAEMSVRALARLRSRSRQS